MGNTSTKELCQAIESQFCICQEGGDFNNYDYLRLRDFTDAILANDEQLTKERDILKIAVKHISDRLEIEYERIIEAATAQYEEEQAEHKLTEED